MGVTKILFILAVLMPLTAFAKWSGEQEIIFGKYGQDAGTFGINVGDSDRTLPEIAAILPSGTILIHDIVNNKMMVFSKNGILESEIYKEIILDKSGKKIKILPRFEIINIRRYMEDGTFFTTLGKGAIKYTESGDVIDRFSHIPSEIGILAISSAEANEDFSISIKYEDINFTILSNVIFDYLIRDRSNYIYTITKAPQEIGIGSVTCVVKYDVCGRQLNAWVKPNDEVEIIPTAADLPQPPIEQYNLIAEYGRPVIGPDGSVYAWKRTPSTYSILKWTWVDSPDDPKGGPDAPTDLTAAPSVTAITLSWKASPQDPGCVEGYEVERSATSGGIFSNITTTAPAVVKYSDNSILPGSSAFYRVRAKSSCGSSPYTAEVSGKRP